MNWFLFSVHHVCVSEGSGSTKAGGGGNAREIRIRKTKKKGRRDEDSDEETGMSQQSTALWSSHFWSDSGFRLLIFDPLQDERNSGGGGGSITGSKIDRTEYTHYLWELTELYFGMGLTYKYI